MKRLQTCTLLLAASLLLSGFTWGNNDPCKEALELVNGLDSLSDDTQKRQSEARIISLCPDGGAANFVAALQFERVGNLDGAISSYRKALVQERSFPLASGNLGLLYVQKGMNDDASVELARALSSISSPKYHKAMARILSERKVYPLAIYHYNEAARDSARDAGIVTGLAEIYSATGQPDKALEEYRRALEINPNLDTARIGIASVHLSRNDLDKALEELKKAETGSPQNRDIHLKMAAIYDKKGDTASADYQYMLGGKPRTPAVIPPKPGEVTLTGNPLKDIELLKNAIKEQPSSAALHEKLGNLYRTNGKEPEAIAAYKEAVHLNSTNHDTYFHLGLLYEKRNQIDEAVVAYKQAVRIKPDSADAHLKLADIRNSRGLYQEAVANYGEFLKLKPDSPDIQLKLARIFARNKENNLAIDAYTSVLKHSPDNIDANREIANLYRLKGSNDKAVEHYTKVLAQQKDDMETRNSLVSVYVKDKKYDEITALLKGTAELFPDDPNNHYKLGLIYEFKKDYESAIAGYRKAVEVKADHARSLNALGRLYMKTGRLTEAKEFLEAAKKADPSLEETSVLLNNLRDDFNPEPRKISKGGKKSKKGKKSTKGKKTAKTAAKKSGTEKSSSKKQQ